MINESAYMRVHWQGMLVGGDIESRTSGQLLISPNSNGVPIADQPSVALLDYSLSSLTIP